VHTLFNVGTVAGLTDDELLERHGPMIVKAVNELHYRKMSFDQILREMKQMLERDPVKVISIGAIEYSLELENLAELEQAKPLLEQMHRLSHSG
jgi:hypothetical protein